MASIDLSVLISLQPLRSPRKKEENWALVQRAQYYYSEGFFLGVCPEAVVTIARDMCARNRPVLVNLSAPLVPQQYFEPLRTALYYAD
ncbi:hypothetical protein PMAYCL1PPCAC_08801, partial [Pristionchus mayeri]